jgi:GT2 family glycosyltransferase
MIPVLGFLTYSRFDLADRLLASIDFPVEHLVIIDNSGKRQYEPKKPDLVKNLWFIQVPHGLGYGGGLNLIVKVTPFAPYWVLLNDDSVLEPGALQKISEQVDTEAINFLSIMPKWSGFVLGEGAVLKAGLFDERFHPIYFEDNDYERRLQAAGVKANFIHAILHHDNSSTLNSGFHSQNDLTFKRNGDLFRRKVAENDLSQGDWDLGIRRANSWDR